MWFQQFKRQFTVLFVLYNGCDATNANFNEQIRDYSVIQDNNFTNVKTLQKEQLGQTRYAGFAPLHNIVRYKDVPDNALSGSSHGRGLLHQDHTGYGTYEYEDPKYIHGPGYDYQHGPDHDHDIHHYDFHEPHHHYGYGHRPKHYNHHALAAKTILWPIAGIALLGAAAALVSNPVLLQLGVVSGRKKRQIENLDFVKDSIKKWSLNAKTGKEPVKFEEIQSVPEFVVKRKVIHKDGLTVQPTGEPKNIREHKSNFKLLTVLSKRYTDEDEEKLVPVPLKFTKP